jgi:hypothetical protein
MKKHFLIGILLGLCVIITGLTFVTPVEAAVLFRPFGGRVTVYAPACVDAIGPFTQMPAGDVSGAAMGYAYPYGLRTPPKIGDWVLGLRIATPAVCATATGATINVYRVGPVFGHSGVK